MTRLGWDANLSVPGGLTASLVVAGLFVPFYDEWAHEVAAIADAAVEDALFEVVGAPLRPLSLHADVSPESSTVLLTLQVRAGANISLDDVVIEYLANQGKGRGQWIGVDSIRDRDGSLGSSIANEEDLFHARIDLGGVVSPGSSFRVWIRCGAEPALVIDVSVPRNLSPITELEWLEAH